MFSYKTVKCITHSRDCILFQRSTAGQMRRPVWSTERSRIEIWLDQDVLKQAGLVFFNGTSARSTQNRDTRNYNSMFSKYVGRSVWTVCPFCIENSGQMDCSCSLIPSSFSRCDFEMLKYCAAAEKISRLKYKVNNNMSVYAMKSVSIRS